MRNQKNDNNILNECVLYFKQNAVWKRLFLGFEKNVEVFVMGLFLAGITSLFLSVIRRKGRTYRIPFAPFLLAGYLFVMVME